ELVRRLQEYERFKQAATDINTLPRQQRDYFPSKVEVTRAEKKCIHPIIALQDIVLAFQHILKQVDLKTHHQIARESLSVRERMSQVLAALNNDDFVEFQTLFTLKEGRLGVVVSFLAILELLKSQLIDMVQAEAYAPIYVKAAMSATEE
ncbi:MAG: segregation/condensation protein A, partial [Cocleimonas sp.]|nr:segregation/condensation protein A [Cocleimonas sp.]